MSSIEVFLPRTGTGLVHFKLSVRSPFPVDGENKHFPAIIQINDHFLHHRTDDLFLCFNSAVLAFPDISKVFAQCQIACGDPNVPGA